MSSTNTNHLSFGAQALRYFLREHENVRREPLATTAAWRGAELVGRTDWMVVLSGAQIDELENAADRALACGHALETITRADFLLPTLASAIRAWADELDAGRGFLLIRGLPVERWGNEKSALVFWGIGQHLGEPGAQNPRDELLGHVLDTGEDSTNPFIRKYRTAANIAYHCDLADVVGLLCLCTARSGGASRIVSSVSVYNELLGRRPDLIDRLYQPFCLDTREEGGTGRAPYVPVVPCCHQGGVLRTFYHSDYLRSATRHPEVPPFTPEEKELLDLYEEIAAMPALYFDMQFVPGDIQLVSNHFVLHARTAYEDWDDPARKRHLLRLWLSL